MTLKQCEAAAETIKAKLVRAGYELKKTEEGIIFINSIDKEVNCNEYNYIHPEHNTRVLIQYCRETSETNKYEFIAMAYFTGTNMNVGLRIKEKDLENGFKKSLARFISKCNETVEKVRKSIQ